MVITNGFMYIAFLMCLAGILLALEKYTKWKIFNVVPPLVWIYVLNMIFCTLGLYHSKEVSAAYKALKNNLLYAMIFVMLLRCDFRKLAKLGGRMVAIFLGCSLTLFVGFIVGYPIFNSFMIPSPPVMAGPKMEIASLRFALPRLTSSQSSTRTRSLMRLAEGSSFFPPMENPCFSVRSQQLTAVLPGRFARYISTSFCNASHVSTTIPPFTKREGCLIDSPV